MIIIDRHFHLRTTAGGGDDDQRRTGKRAMAWCRAGILSDAFSSLTPPRFPPRLPPIPASAASSPPPPPPPPSLTSSPPPPPPPPPSLSSSSQLPQPPPPSPRTHDDLVSKSRPHLSRWAHSRRLHKIRRSGSSSPLAPSPSDVRRVTEAKLPLDDHPNTPVSGSGNQHENAIYMVSDGTGWTAEHCVNAVLGQFEHCLVDQGCPVNTHLFSQVSEVERLVEIVRDAARENAMLIYTLADPALAETAKKACKLYGITYVDLLGPITELLGLHMGVTPLGLPRGAPGRKMTLSRKYFKMIEAIEFTIKQDDGALPQNLHKADLVLVGVSRTSKTPLSTYMAQKGYKVANVPLVLGIKPPKELFEIDQAKIYALTINPNFLHSIRIARSNTLGLSTSSFYSNLDHIRDELEYSNKLFMENPKWPVIEVTGKAIEETAAVILRIYHDREKKHVMPHISHRY